MASLEAILTCNRNLALSISYFSGWMLKKVVLFCIWIYILESDDLKIKNIFIVFTTRSLLMPCNVCPKAKNNVVYKRSSTFPVPVLVIVLIIVSTSTTIRWNKHRELSCYLCDLISPSLLGDFFLLHCSYVILFMAKGATYNCDFQVRIINVDGLFLLFKLCKH